MPFSAVSALQIGNAVLPAEFAFSVKSDLAVHRELNKSATKGSACRCTRLTFSALSGMLNKSVTKLWRLPRWLSAAPAAWPLYPEKRRFQLLYLIAGEFAFPVKSELDV